MTQKIDETNVPPDIKRTARAICIDRGFDPEKRDVHGLPAWIEWVEVAKIARAALLTADDGSKLLTIDKDDAERICKRLEFDASWDKVGSGYYVLKQQIQAT